MVLRLNFDRQRCVPSRLKAIAVNVQVANEEWELAASGEEKLWRGKVLPQPASEARVEDSSPLFKFSSSFHPRFQHVKNRNYTG